MAIPSDALLTVVSMERLTRSERFGRAAAFLIAAAIVVLFWGFVIKTLVGWF